MKKADDHLNDLSQPSPVPDRHQANKSVRDARLKAALKANMARRKQQIKARMVPPGQDCDKE